MATRTLNIIIICITAVIIAAIFRAEKIHEIKTPQTEDAYLTALKYCGSLKANLQTDCRAQVTKYYLAEVRSVQGDN